MRPLFILILLALLTASCNFNMTISDSSITLDSLMMYDRIQLEKFVGDDKLRDYTEQNAEGRTVYFTTFMPDTRAEVKLQWTDSTYMVVDLATIRGNDSAWKTQDSVTLGMSMVELEQINGQPFSFFNDGPDVVPPTGDMQVTGEPGYVFSWGLGAESGKLQRNIHALRLSASIPPGDNSTYLFDSNSEEAIANNPGVIEITLSRTSKPIDIKVETVVFTTRYGTKSNIPHIVSTGKPDPRIDAMNEIILERFMIPSFDPKEIENFHWENVTFNTEMDENTVAIHFKGTFVGAYPTDIDDALFISKSGYENKKREIPFHTLFKYDGYFNFLDKYWSPGCDKAMQKARECADMEPSCSCFDIQVKVFNEKLVLSEWDDCYPHVAGACSPKVTVRVPLQELRPYLNDFGKRMMYQERYYEQSHLKKQNLASEVAYRLPNVMFLRFDIDHEDGVIDPTQMGLLLEPGEDPFSGKVTGWLKFMDIEQDPIKLEGTFSEEGTLVVHDPEESIAGEFTFQWRSNAGEQYDDSEGYTVEGSWKSPDYNYTNFKFIAVRYDGFKFYEPRGD